MKLQYPHRPVLAHEVVRTLITVSDGVYVDGTVGSGGHSEGIARDIAAKGRLICLDRDSEAIRLSRARLGPLGKRVTVIKGNYAELKEILHGLGFEKVNGFFLDLGMSGYQLEHSGRGFSFNRDEPLDMRMDLDDEVTAHQLVNSLSPKELEKVLRDYGEEKRARSIVKSIERERRKRPIDASLQLANLIQAVVPRSHRSGARHPATLTFQALRIAVNRELENLKRWLDDVPALMTKGGRLVVLSYHSLEDRMVKQAMVNWEKGCCCPPDLPACACGKKPLFRRLQKKGLRPDQEEIQDNPRARSAILRAAERI
jgi:16S rRNA (cytosine1402-N4)-methyltransferase